MSSKSKSRKSRREELEKLHEDCIIVAGNPAISYSNSEMMTEESLKVLKENKNGRISKEDADNLECTIKLRHSTVEALKEVAYQNNFGTYDSTIMGLIRSYRKESHV